MQTKSAMKNNNQSKDLQKVIDDFHSKISMLEFIYRKNNKTLIFIRCLDLLFDKYLGKNAEKSLMYAKMLDDNIQHTKLTRFYIFKGDVNKEGNIPKEFKEKVLHDYQDMCFGDGFSEKFYKDLEKKNAEQEICKE